MADYKKIENYISNIATIWHNAGMEASNYVGCMLYVMGLKKMVEENACMNPEYMSSIVALTKWFYIIRHHQVILILSGMHQGCWKRPIMRKKDCLQMFCQPIVQRKSHGKRHS